MNPRNNKKVTLPKTKTKSINKRFNTFNSSQFSIIQDKNYASASVSDLLHHDLPNRKHYNASVSSNRPPKKLIPQHIKTKKLKTSLKNKKIKQQIIMNVSSLSQERPNFKYSHNDVIKNRKKNHVSTTSNPPLKKQSKNTKPFNSSSFHHKQPPYQHVYLNPSNSQSQIVFSNQDTKRKQSNIKKLYLESNPLIIDCHEEYKVKATKKEETNKKEFINSMLRNSIKKEYQKKVDAAIKIQKVYRGYMTRKILDKYVREEEIKLMKRLAEIQQIYSNRQQKRNLYLQNSNQRVHQSQSDSNQKTFEDVQRSILSSSRVLLQQLNSTKKEPINNHTFKVINQQKQHNDQDKSQSDEDNVIVYRHQQPIYSHQEISKYLDDDSQQQQEQDQVYQPQIIFQTNEQYIQSRKSSLQNKNQPKNHLINKLFLNQTTKNELKNQEVVGQELLKSFNQSAKILQNLKYKKKDQITQQSQQIKGQNQKKFNASFSKNQVIQYSLLKKIREVSNSSSSSSLNNKNQSQRQQLKIAELKEGQKQKWQQVIQMLTQQVKKTEQNNAEMVYFMNSIIEISKKNKQQLNNQLEQYESYTTPTTVDNKMESIQYEDQQPIITQIMLQPKQKRFQKKKKNLQIQIIEEPNSSIQQICLKSKFKDGINNSFKKQSLRKQLKSPNNQKNQLNSQFKSQNQKIQKLELQKVLSQNQSHKNSLRQQTIKLKNFLNENIQDQSIQAILKIRQQLLEKLQSQTLMKINNQLAKKELTQQQFIDKLEQFTYKIQKEKQSIEKARNDIQKGYNAALGIVKQAYKDAKTLGIKVSLSRSLGNLKLKIVDQFQSFTPKGSNNEIFNSINYPINLQSVRNNTKSIQSESESDVDFTEEQLNHFRKIQHYDSQFIQMNKNITIGEDFVKKHFNPQKLIKNDRETKQNMQDHIQLSSQAYRQRYQIDDIPIKQNPQLDYLTDRQLDYLIYQCAIQFLMKPILNERIYDRSHLTQPKKILKEQQILFIKFLQQLLVDPYQLLHKLNQKITPLPFQLLKCMRIDFSDSTDDNQFDSQYEQIGKYQFIISQDICSKALEMFKLKIQQTNQISQTNISQKTNPFISNYKDFQSINKQYKFQDKIFKYIQQKQRFIKQRRQHTKGLRWQVLNIEVHCIFDGWNQQLIQLRTKKPGYSGIGLNELTLSTMDHNHPITIDQVYPLVKKAKKMLLDVMNDESKLVQKIQRQNFEQMCYNDSLWIYYADQALSYGLQLGYLIQQDVFSQLVNQIANKFINNQSKSIIFQEQSDEQNLQKQTNINQK